MTTFQRSLTVPVILWIAGTLVVNAAETPADVDLVWGVKIPLRDGLRLNGTIVKPKPMSVPVPVIFTLTPYIADSYLDRAMYFARNGYVFALVDVRGRGNSGGAFEPFVNEGKDGYDVVEWLAKQPWSNGKVAMWGGSYAGFDQWSTAKEFPPHLATIVPAAAAHPGVDFPFSGGVFTSYVMRWLTLTSGLTPNTKLFGDDVFWRQKFFERYETDAPFKDLDRIVGNASTVFQKWLQHPTPDDYWEAMRPSESEYRKLSIPILTITAYYDGDQKGALHYYRNHMLLGSTGGRDRHYLIVGPWDHAGTRTPTREVGGLKFGEASLVDLNKLHKQWYDWTMKSGPKPEFLKDRVAYYVIGAEKWRYAPGLENVGTSTRVLYLDSRDGSANDLFHSGMLTDQKPSGPTPDSYVYDPRDHRPAEAKRSPAQNFLTDQAGLLDNRGDWTVYHSAPFGKATEVSGFTKLELWLSMDVPDTDFEVALYEVLSDGSSVLLASNVRRARYRKSLRRAELVKSGEANEYEFELSFFSRQIAKGSRLRLFVTSPNSPGFEKNYNGGGEVAAESLKDARTAHVQLLHDDAHLSRIELPIGRSE